MAKKISIILGIIFIIVGILGYISNPLVGDAGIFATNNAHDIVHILSGVIFLIFGFTMQSKVSIVLKVFGIVYLLVAILGFFAVDSTTGTGNVLSFITVNGADNWLHVVLAIVIFAAGIAAGKNDTVATATTSAPTTPVTPSNTTPTQM